jgi:1-acyl-sn-glycerol-3-phosphate acyltransferase
MRKFYKYSGNFVRALMRHLWGCEVIHGERLSEAKSLIIASNHISWYDPPLIGAVIPYEIAYLAKAELFKNRLFRALITTLNAIPITRNAGDMKGITNAMNVLNSGKSLLMFPEGTRKGKNIKPGVGMFAMKMRKDILPLYIENSDRLMSCVFSSKRKIRIVVGEQIKAEYFAEWEENKESYQRLAEYVYGKIGELRMH